MHSKRKAIMSMCSIEYPKHDAEGANGTYLVLLCNTVLPLQILAQVERYGVLKLGGGRVSLSRDCALASKWRQIILEVAHSEPTVECVLC